MSDIDAMLMKNVHQYKHYSKPTLNQWLEMSSMLYEIIVSADYDSTHYNHVNAIVVAFDKKVDITKSRWISILECYETLTNKIAMITPAKKNKLGKLNFASTSALLDAGLIDDINHVFSKNGLSISIDKCHPADVASAKNATDSIDDTLEILLSYIDNLEIRLEESTSKQEDLATRLSKLECHPADVASAKNATDSIDDTLEILLSYIEHLETQLEDLTTKQDDLATRLSKLECHLSYDNLAA